MKYKQIITIDFETYFDTEYSLKSKHYNTSEYIRDEKFKVHCLAYKINDAPVNYVSGANVDLVLRSIDWSTSALLAHNTAFDGFILSHRYGIVPAFYLDTLSMARAVHANSIRNRLGDVAAFYGVGNKLPDVLDKTKGLRDLNPDLELKLMRYCAVDVELCYQIYQELKKDFPESELKLIDLTLRMFCDPILLIDVAAAEAELKRELDEREEIIKQSGESLKVLRSARLFADALTSRGVTPPTKISKRTEKEAYAFAKSDLDFQELLTEQYNDDVRALARARIAAKSTINETRAIRFIRAGGSGKLPILLNYYGAHTSRWSAGNKMNMQNLPRGGALRRAIRAPAGQKIVSCDSSQIEARVLSWLADHELMLTAFRMWDKGEGPDVYKVQAAGIYKKHVSDVSKDERFVGKVSTLGLGYGMGAEKFRYTLAAGIMGPPVDMTLAACTNIVSHWRIINLPIPAFWDRMNKALVQMVMKFTDSYKCLSWGPEKVYLPRGITLKYPNLTGDYDEINGRYTSFKYYSLDEAVKKRLGLEVAGHKIYGGLMTENIVQALARIIVADQMLKIAERHRVVTMTHDEVVCVVPDAVVDEAKAFMIDVMRTPPDWAPDIPLNAEAEAGDTYG